MNQPIRLSDYPNQFEYEKALTHAWIKEEKERISQLSEEELTTEANEAHDLWHEMFGEKVEPVFDDHHNYDVVRPEPWWHRFF